MSSLSKGRAGSTQTLRVFVAFLCVVLVLFVGAAQLLHTHAADEASNPGCGLCAVAHLSALPTPVLARPVVAEFILPVRAARPVSAPSRFFSFSLYVRPPPASTPHA